MKIYENSNHKLGCIIYGFVTSNKGGSDEEPWYLSYCLDICIYGYACPCILL